MKRRTFLSLTLAAALLLCACTGKPAASSSASTASSYPDSRSEKTRWVIEVRKVEFPSKTAEHGEDGPIQWEDPAMEAHIRFILGKPEGEIRRSDVWNIQFLVFRANQPSGFDIALEQPVEGDTFTSDLEVERSIRHNYDGTLFENLTTLSDLRYFDSLQYFDYSGSTPYDGPTDLSGVETCTALKNFELTGAKPASLEPLAGLQELESLTLDYCGTLDLTPLEGLPELSALSLRADKLVSLEPLTTLPKLCYLAIGVGTTYPSLEPLTRTEVEFLDMGLSVGDEKTYKGMDYEPLTRLPKLRYLSLMNHFGVTTDLCRQIAAGSPQLRGLDISYTPAADHANELDDLGIEWLTDAPLKKDPVDWWRRFLYWLA